MAAELIPDQIFMLILVIILAVVVIIVVSQWKKVSQSNNTLKLMEKERATSHRCWCGRRCYSATLYRGDTPARPAP